MTQEKYQPSPEELQKAEETMTDEQKMQSESRAEGFVLGKQEALDSEKLPRIEVDGKILEVGPILPPLTNEEAIREAGWLGFRIANAREIQQAQKNGIIPPSGDYWNGPYTTSSDGEHTRASWVQTFEGKITKETGAPVDYHGNRDRSLCVREVKED